MLKGTGNREQGTGNREQGTGNSVGNVRGFEERPKLTAFLRRGSPTPEDHREILTKNGKQFVPHCSPFPVPCSLF